MILIDSFHQFVHPVSSAIPYPVQFQRTLVPNASPCPAHHECCKMVQPWHAPSKQPAADTNRANSRCRHQPRTRSDKVFIQSTILLPYFLIKGASDPDVWCRGLRHQYRIILGLVRIWRWLYYEACGSPIKLTVQFWIPTVPAPVNSSVLMQLLDKSLFLFSSLHRHLVSYSLRPCFVELSSRIYSLRSMSFRSLRCV